MNALPIRQDLIAANIPAASGSTLREEDKLRIKEIYMQNPTINKFLMTQTLSSERRYSLLSVGKYLDELKTIKTPLEVEDKALIQNMYNSREDGESIISIWHKVNETLKTKDREYTYSQVQSHLTDQIRDIKHFIQEVPAPKPPIESTLKKRRINPVFEQPAQEAFERVSKAAEDTKKEPILKPKRIWAGEPLSQEVISMIQNTYKAEPMVTARDLWNRIKNLPDSATNRCCLTEVENQLSLLKKRIHKLSFEEDDRVLIEDIFSEKAEHETVDDVWHKVNERLESTGRQYTFFQVKQSLDFYVKPATVKDEELIKTTYQTHLNKQGKKVGPLTLMKLVNEILAPTGRQYPENLFKRFIDAEKSHKRKQDLEKDNPFSEEDASSVLEKLSDGHMTRSGQIR